MTRTRHSPCKSQNTRYRTAPLHQNNLCLSLSQLKGCISHHQSSSVCSQLPFTRTELRHTQLKSCWQFHFAFRRAPSCLLSRWGSSARPHPRKAPAAPRPQSRAHGVTAPKNIPSWKVPKSSSWVRTAPPKTQTLCLVALPKCHLNSSRLSQNKKSHLLSRTFPS